MSDRFHHMYIAPSDWERSLAFYRDTLGWAVMNWNGGEGKPRSAVLSAGGMRMVLEEALEEKFNCAGRPTLHLDIHDIDRRFREIPPGVHVVKPPENTAWGTRWFVVRDPDGNLIAFEEVHGG